MSDSALSASLAAPLTEDDFRIVFLPDPQVYSEQYPEIFAAQTQWCIDNAAALNIRAVLCEGDNVQNHNSLTEWDRAQAALGTLNTGGLPHLIAMGNHDYAGADIVTKDSTRFNTYFPPTWYTAQGWFAGGFYNEAKSENVYTTITVGSYSYLLLCLEMYPSAEVIAWADSLISANADKTVIVVTHAYIDSPGIILADAQPLHTMLKTHDNVLLVGSGHIPAPGNGYLNTLTTGANPSRMHMFACNYQDNRPYGGNGYLRIVTIKRSRNEMLAETYSPTMAAWDAAYLQRYLMQW